MPDIQIEITATGRKNAEAEDCEVIFLGLHAPGVTYALVADEIDAGDAWSMVVDVIVGPPFDRLPLGLKGCEGSVALSIPNGARLAMLSYPWSGVCSVSDGGESFDVDLYAPEPRVLFVDPATAEAKPVETAVDLIELTTAEEHVSARLSAPGKQAAPVNAPRDTLVIRPTGEQNPRALDHEVIVRSLEPFGHGVSANLNRLVSTPGWTTVTADDGVFIKGVAGEIALKASEEGRVVLQRHPWSGLAELQYDDDVAIIDLYAPQTETVEFRVKDIKGLADAMATLYDGNDGRQTTGGPDRVPKDARRATYERLSAGFDPQAPVALYVPRWHGVALSSQTLFTQHLPLPAGSAEHPDEITDADVSAYASILRGLGLRHLVVSGGDTFNLRIMNAIHEQDRSVRFDVLWHSNYLQMGEPHDWNLLRHWLPALRDGRVSRIGVVKKGLERWFANFGIDSVFVPNVVPIKARSLKPSGVTDTVGVWLSGSSSYRKSPMASLSAVSMLPGVKVSGSGLDPAARQLISDAGIAFGKIWEKPLPRTMLHKQMRQTGLTLYVTLSECSPMLPLESFALGVPCLIGPSSHLFRDDETLRNALIVERPMSPAAIAEKASDALRNQASLVDSYKQHYKTMMAEAKAGVKALVA